MDGWSWLLSTSGEFESDLNRFILLENMEEEERKGKEFEQILEDENIKSKGERHTKSYVLFSIYG